MVRNKKTTKFVTLMLLGLLWLDKEVGAFSIHSNFRSLSNRQKQIPLLMGRPRRRIRMTGGDENDATKEVDTEISTTTTTTTTATTAATESKEGSTKDKVENEESTLANEKIVLPEIEEYSVRIGIGSRLKVDSLEFPQSLLVEGTLNGKLQCLQPPNQKDPSRVVVAKGGEIRSNSIIKADLIEVQGRMISDVSCLQLVVGSNAELIGNIHTKRLYIENGGTILGMVRSGKASCPNTTPTKLPSISTEFAKPPTKEKSPVTEKSLANGKDQANEKRLANKKRPATKKPPTKVKTISSQEQMWNNRRDLMSSLQGGVPRRSLNDVEKMMPKGVGGRKRPPPTAKKNSNISKPLHANKPPLMDDFGNPLFAPANIAQIDSFRRNKEVVQSVRVFLDDRKPTIIRRLS